MDGALTTIGIPLIIIGNLFQPQYTKKLYFLSGIGYVGGAPFALGLALNSKRYRAQVDFLENLCRQAARNPTLTATDALRAYRANPQATRALGKKLGKSRAAYLFNLLTQAEVIQRQRGVSLATFLTPMAQAKQSLSPFSYQA